MMPIDRSDARPEPVHFVQMWIRPDEAGRFTELSAAGAGARDLARGWVPIASGSHADAVGENGQRRFDSVGQCAPAGTSRLLPNGERLHVYLARGVLDAEAIGPLEAGIRSGCPGPTQLKITARAEAEVLVWQMDRGEEA